ncbi:hypothetical protein K458DRAFT_384241 [Lentithecium fluviatile CBS 122367]|uniref:Uncharacterized protein n=1 Tax=Lentithecium fluviatile CBS 122367 TaxID=1168545 RepID=A0A6G1JHA8_9PLEO|nr:hypothetical protein K458DRAFT_384241 [Lentithecium fluviatile CBS 122367]
MDGIVSFGNGYAALPSQLGIVNLQDQSKQLCVDINWGNRTVKEVLDIAYHPRYGQNPASREIFGKYLSNTYNATGGVGLNQKTSGYIMLHVQAKLRQFGVEKDNCLIVAWTMGNYDYKALAKGLNGNENIMVRRDSLSFPFERFSVMRVLQRITDLDVLQLKYVHKCYSQTGTFGFGTTPSSTLRPKPTLWMKLLRGSASYHNLICEGIVGLNGKDRRAGNHFAEIQVVE